MLATYIPKDLCFVFEFSGSQQLLDKLRMPAVKRLLYVNIFYIEANFAASVD